MKNLLFLYSIPCRKSLVCDFVPDLPHIVKQQTFSHSRFKMSSNFDPYQTPSTSLGAIASNNGGFDNNTDDDDSDSKNSQSYKERRSVQ